MSELHAEQATFVKRCEARIHLLDNMGKAFESGRPEEVEQWTRQRVDRILVDHLLREGYYRTAAVLAEEGKLQDYVDLDMFAATRRVEDSLKGRSCAEALAWCSENRSKLRKLKSSLEFNLRLQEYIELVRFGKFNNAITYARKYLTMWMDSNAKDVQMVAFFFFPSFFLFCVAITQKFKALALLAFPNQETRCERYRQLYDPARWNQLAEQFKNDNFQLYSLTQQSLLNITLQGGLSALKTPMCNEVCHFYDYFATHSFFFSPVHSVGDEIAKLPRVQSANGYLGQVVAIRAPHALVHRLPHLWSHHGPRQPPDDAPQRQRVFPARPGPNAGHTRWHHHRSSNRRSLQVFRVSKSVYYVTKSSLRSQDLVVQYRSQGVADDKGKEGREDLHGQDDCRKRTLLLGPEPDKECVDDCKVAKKETNFFFIYKFISSLKT